MISVEELERQFIAEGCEKGYEETPYGWIGKITPTRQLIILNPKADTGMGAYPTYLGLRSHPGVHKEFVTHLGYVDGNGEKDLSLVHIFSVERLSLVKVPNSPIVFSEHKKGDSFISRHFTGTGYWHSFFNKSDRPIKLRIEWE